MMSSALVHLKDPWTLSWVLSGFLSILIPVITWNVQKGKYYSAYGYALEAEEQQRQYYENQNGNNNNNNGNNNNGNYYNYYKECSWINFSCRKKQYYYATAEERQKAYEEGNMLQELPGWYIFLGGAENSEEMQKWKEENTGQRGNANSSEGGLKFVYTMTLFLFIALVGYGAVTLGKKQPLTNLIALLVITSVVALMNLAMTAQGVISSDDRDMEDSYYGWYGQMGVLIAYTDFWFILFSLAYLIAFRVRSFLEQRGEPKDGDDEEFMDDGAADYKAPSEVQMA